MKSYFFISLYRENAFVASDYLPVFAAYFCAFVQKIGKVSRNECLIWHFSFSQGKEYSKAASKAISHKSYGWAPFFACCFSAGAQRKPSIFGTCFHFVITAKEILFIRKPTKLLYFCAHFALYAANFVQLVQKRPFFLAISHLYKMKKVF